jgi:hypothetical protein
VFHQDAQETSWCSGFGGFRIWFPVTPANAVRANRPVFDTSEKALTALMSKNRPSAEYVAEDDVIITGQRYTRTELERLIAGRRAG